VTPAGPTRPPSTARPARPQADCEICTLHTDTTPYRDAAGTPREVCVRCRPIVRLSGWEPVEPFP